MACNCGGKSKRDAVVWRVKYADGRPPEDYLTEIEARASLSVSGVKGTYTRTLKPKANART